MVKCSLEVTHLLPFPSYTEIMSGSEHAEDSDSPDLVQVVLKQFEWILNTCGSTRGGSLLVLQ